MCAAIDDTHIQLYQKPPQYHVLANYWSSNNIHKIFLQGIYDGDRSYWNIYINALGRTHDAIHVY